MFAIQLASYLAVATPFHSISFHSSWIQARQVVHPVLTSM